MKAEMENEIRDVILDVLALYPKRSVAQIHTVYLPMIASLTSGFIFEASGVIVIDDCNVRVTYHRSNMPLVSIDFVRDVYEENYDILEREPGGSLVCWGQKLRGEMSECQSDPEGVMVLLPDLARKYAGEYLIGIAKETVDLIVQQSAGVPLYFSGWDSDQVSLGEHVADTRTYQIVKELSNVMVSRYLDIPLELKKDERPLTPFSQLERKEGAEQFYSSISNTSELYQKLRNVWVAELNQNLPTVAWPRLYWSLKGREQEMCLSAIDIRGERTYTNISLVGMLLVRTLMGPITYQYKTETVDGADRFRCTVSNYESARGLFKLLKTLVACDLLTHTNGNGVSFEEAH